MTVIANRLDGIVREMTNTLLRAARSAVISSARDFSCCILTGDNQLLASAEGLPVHIFGAHLQGENVSRYHAGESQERLSPLPQPDRGDERRERGVRRELHAEQKCHDQKCAGDCEPSRPLRA